MELFTLSTLIALIIVLVTYSVIKLSLNFKYQWSYWKKKGVPCYVPWPFTGEGGKLFLRKITFVDYCNFLYTLLPGARYFGTMDFATPVLIVRDPEMIKVVTVKSFDNFPDHRPFMDETVDPIFGKNVFMLKGDRWRKMRNTLTPAFTTTKMRFLFDLIAKTSEKFVGYLADHPEITAELELKDVVTRYTNDVVATAAFGIDIDSMKNRKNEFFVRGLQVAQFGGYFGMIKMMLIRLCPWLPKFVGLSIFPAGTMRFFTSIIGETLKTRRDQGIVRPDMIHLLMEARDSVAETGKQITVDDIAAQAFGFFLAGFDTTSTFMCSLIYELAVNTDVQEKLHEEIDRITAESNGELSYEVLLKMQYLEQVVSETLRKYTPLVVLDRICTKDVTLPSPVPGEPDVEINAGTVILFPVHALQNDPKYFPEPEKFDPERFSEENKEKIVPYSYIPFGAGPRKCIANRFVMMEAKILIVHLLRIFSVKRTEKTVYPIVYSKKSFQPVPENGFWVRLEKRKTS